MGIADASAVNQYIDGTAQDKARNVGALLSAKVVTNLPKIKKRLTAAYGDQALPPFLDTLPDWFAGYAHDRLTQAATEITAFDKLAAQGRVAGVVVHEDVSLEMRAAVAWARARGVPTIHVPHAPCHLHPGVTDIHAEIRSEYVAASGLYEQEYYEAAGVEKGKAIITGNPAWDYLYETGAIPERDEARRVLGLPADARVICYATTWGQTTSVRSRFGAEFNEGLNAVIAYAKAADAILIVKIHPNQNPEEGQQIAKALEQVGVKGMVMREHLSYALRASDVLIAQSPSNLCIEAAILGVPSCYIQTESFDYKHPLPFRCDVAGLSAAVDAAMASNPEAWQDFVTYYNAVHPDGMAVEKTVEFIEKICPTI